MAQTLKQALVPRDSVFDTNLSDTVYGLDDLGYLNATQFFEENFVTSGMKQLLTEVFSRLDGSNPDANGAFLLNQSMGGGKTHNLLALGLLAQVPEIREKVMGDFYAVRPTEAIKVVTFSGRENPEFGIWGSVAEQLGRSEFFSSFYSPLRAPGESDWVKLLEGDRTLILIDELPPYLNQALQIPLGQSTLAHATQSALANLLAAINSGKLPNVTLVLTDLSGSSYSLADDRLQGVLSDMEKEAERTVQTISPVRLDTPELYDILRTRLFAELPDEAQINDIAAEFRAAIEEAGRTLDVPTDRANDLQNGIRRTYPFHPSLQDILARFRENSNYQQTRALIRIMRQVVAGMWKDGVASDRYLIGAHDIDTSNTRLASEVAKINDRFDNAIAHDITNDTNDAVAQHIDGPSSRNAQDAARLILISSLSLATNPSLGLTRADIISYLASPGRNVGNLNGALDDLIDQAWYLHATADNRILFRSTENVRARLEGSVKNVSGDAVRTEVAKKLAELYAPVNRDVYQEVEALPDLKDISITQDKTTLIIARPEPIGSSMLEDFYNSLNYKNRVLFITSREQEYNTVVDRMRYLIATRQMLKEFEQSGYKPDDPQLIEARELSTKYESNFYQALRESFFMLLSPARNGRLSTEFSPQYDGNKFQGETVVRDTLVDRHQYETPAEMMTDQFRGRIEKELWPAEQKEVAWNQIRIEAAQNPGFPMHHPGKLEDVRQLAIDRGLWRLIDEGKFVQRGPFEKEKARIAPPKRIGEPDPKTGAVTLKIDAVNADQVIYISPDGQEQVVQGGQITINELSGTFVAKDSKGEYESAEPLQWQNEIRIRYDLYTDGNKRRVKLEAVPNAAIKYTIDGSSPLYAGLPYTSPIALGDNATKVLAIAQAEGVKSKLEEFNIPAVVGDQKVTVDEHQPAAWKRSLAESSTGGTFELLSLLERFGAELSGIELAAEDHQHYSSWSSDADTFFSVDQVRTIADLLIQFHAGREIRIEIGKTSYKTGADLLSVVRERQDEIKPDQLEQRV